MAIKEYFIITNGFRQSRIMTGDAAHQAQIEAHSDTYALKHLVDPDTGKKIKESHKVKKLKNRLAKPGDADWLEEIAVDQEFYVLPTGTPELGLN